MKPISYSLTPYSPQPILRPGLLVILAALLITAAALAGCSAAPAAVTQPAPTAASAWEEISVAKAAAYYEAGTFMLDVRQPEEWNEIHIPGATLIPLGELQGRLSELPKDQEIVVYCRSGNRSQSGAEILAKNGFAGVSSMAGGIREWSAAGYPTETGP